MMYNGVFDVDPAFIRGGSIIWRMTGNGEFVIATRGGQQYFVKRNMHVRLPAKSLPKDVYDVLKRDADAIEGKQKKLKSLMKGLDWRTDHVVVELEHFWDDEKMFVTVTPNIKDGLPDTYDYTALGKEEFIALATEAAKAMDKLHAHGVIHGDIKVKNIIVTHDGGAYTPYLIDFDSSYPVSDIPEHDGIGGSDGYQSPEIIYYGNDDAAPKGVITPATDIFSLGVVFHKWWTGALPGTELKSGSAGVALYHDKAVIIDKKFNVQIGDNCGATLLSLINWMLAKDPEKRPTAGQVSDVLGDKLEVPEEYHKGNDAKPFKAELWDAHTLIAQLLPKAELKKLGVKAFTRINDGGGSSSLKYRITEKGGAEKTLIVTELIDAGYAKGKSAEIDEPWDEHFIELEPADEIVKKGYAKIQRAKIAYSKRYIVTTVSGREVDKGYEWLIAEGLARPKTFIIDGAETPWPEHGKAYDPVGMAKLGVKSISRMEVCGEHRYRIVYNEIKDGVQKVNERVHVNNLKLMGFIK